MKLKYGFSKVPTLIILYFQRDKLNQDLKNLKQFIQNGKNKIFQTRRRN